MAALNLQSKIVLYTVGLILLLVTALTGVNAWLDYRTAHQNLRERVLSLSQEVAIAVQADFSANRFEKLEAMLRNLSLNSRLVGIEVLDPEGKRLIASPGSPPADVIPDNPHQAPVITTRNGLVRVVTPIGPDVPAPPGYLRLTASGREDLLLIRKQVRRSLAFAAVFSVLGCLAAWFAGHRLVHPLRRLAKAAENLAEGRKTEMILSRSGDEVGQLARSFNHMIEKRKATEISLERSRQHLLFILRETPLGYIQWDLDFRVLSWNKAAEKIFGYSSRDARGRHAMELIVPECSRSRVEEVWQRILSRDGGTSSLDKNRRADGSMVVCQWNNTVISDPDGSPVAVASLVNDVTESINTQETMRIAMEEAQKATRAKSEFLANMSHEIRTPMNGVIGLTELLLESELDAQQRSSLEVIHSSGELLITIINDILDLSRIESGKLELSEKPFNLRESLERSFDLFVPETKGRDLRTSVELDESIPSLVNGDPNRLRQITYNLISNAVKFTPSGSIRLKARAEPVTSMRIRLFITVADTGSGIDARYIDSIFEPFSQADSSSTRMHGGTGLGLTICKHLCTLMRGDIALDQSSPEGTSFTFHLELQTIPASPVQNSRSAAVGNPSPPTTPDTVLSVLVAEDNAVNRLVAQRLLTRLGHTCHSVENGQEAIDFLENHPCDVIFMDLQMPVMDGFAATRRIRSTHGPSRPAIIALTASAIEGDRERCLAAGMDDYLAKPVSISALSRVLKGLA